MSFDGFDDGFDADALGLPPLDDASLPDRPPPPRDEWLGVTIGADLAGAFMAEVLPREPADQACELGRSLAQGIAAAKPGVAELARLESTDLARLDAAARVAALVDIERLQGWLDSLQERLLAQISTDDTDADRWCVDEVAAALKLAGGAAQARLKNAEQLCQRLPSVLATLADGNLSAPHVTAIVEASFPLPEEALPQFEAAVLAKASRLTVPQLRRWAKRVAASLDPATAAQRRTRAQLERFVRISPADDGMASLFALLPAVEALALYARLDGVARAASSEDPRTLDQLRADALVNGILNGASDESSSTNGRKPAIAVTVGLDTLVGKDDEPGWLAGYGPIDADYARQIAHDQTGTWRRIITDPASGQLLDYGRSRYRPPAQLAEHVVTRDGECAFPFCSHPAHSADLDHIIPYPQGKTASDNLQPLHRRHHNAKTRGGWASVRNADGSTSWTSPLGRLHHTEPPPRWPGPVSEGPAGPTVDGHDAESGPDPPDTLS